MAKQEGGGQGSGSTGGGYDKWFDGIVGKGEIDAVPGQPTGTMHRARGPATARSHGEKT
jgi:hypothetical protein